MILIPKNDQYLVYVHFSDNSSFSLIARTHFDVFFFKKKRLYNLLETNLQKTSSSRMIQKEKRSLITNSSSLISFVKGDWRKIKLCIFWSTLPRFSRQRLIWFLWRVLLQVRSWFWIGRFRGSSTRCGFVSSVCGDIHGQYVSSFFVCTLNTHPENLLPQHFML